MNIANENTRMSRSEKRRIKEDAARAAAERERRSQRLSLSDHAIPLMFAVLAFPLLAPDAFIALIKMFSGASP